jgi:hypothetical protein
MVFRSVFRKEALWLCLFVTGMAALTMNDVHCVTHIVQCAALISLLSATLLSIVNTLLCSRRLVSVYYYPLGTFEATVCYRKV